MSALLPGIRVGNAAVRNRDHFVRTRRLMMSGIVIAIVSMSVVVLAHHTGFVERAYAVCGDIVKCPMCCSLWGTLVVLLLTDHGLLEAIALSFLVAYLSNWFGLLLSWLSKKYEILWQRSNRQS